MKIRLPYDENGDSLVFKQTTTGGFDIRIIGGANYGWYDKDEFWYYGNIPINYIGNYTQSYLAPFIMHILAVLDCENYSGPKHRQKYMSDRLAGYLAGFNASSFALSGNNSWWGILGVADFILATSLKAAKQQKKKADLYDDRGSSQGFLLGFLIHAFGNLISGRKMTMSNRLLLPLVAGVFPSLVAHMKSKYKKSTLRGMFGSSIRYQPEIGLSPNDPKRNKEERLVNIALQEVGWDGLKEITLQLAGRRDTPKLEKLWAYRRYNLFLPVINLIIPYFGTLEGEKKITRAESRHGLRILLLDLEAPYHKFYSDTPKYVSMVKRINDNFAEVEGLDNFKDLFVTVRPKIHAKKPWWEPWPTNLDRNWHKLFFMFSGPVVIGKEHLPMYPRTFTDIFETYINFLEWCKKIPSQTARMMRSHFALNSSYYVKNFYNKYGVRHLRDVPAYQ